MILQQFIFEYCKENDVTIEDILRREKHALYHKRCITKACCTCCTGMSLYSRVIPENQWIALYEVFEDSDSHLCKLDMKDCCERFVPKRINKCDLSVSKTLILNIPDIVTYTVRNLCVRGFDKFLKQYQHEICHYMKGKRCCRCDKVPSKKPVFDSSQLEYLFIKSNNSSCHTGILDCCCQYSVRKGVEYTDIDANVLSKILNVAGPFSVLNRIEDDAFSYFLTWTVDEFPLLRALKELLNGIQDQKFYHSILFVILNQSHVTTTKQIDARRWISRNLAKQKVRVRFCLNCYKFIVMSMCIILLFLFRNRHIQI